MELTSYPETKGDNAMKLELPDDHPIAEAIREATKNAFQDHLFLSLDVMGRNGHRRLFSLQIDSWTLTTNTEKRFELDLTDHLARTAEIEAMTRWPDLPRSPA